MDGDTTVRERRTHCLIIRHLGGRQFAVSRLSDGKSAPAVELTAPDAIAVEGRPDSNLLHDLRWYLERFLEYPLSPHIEVAERIQRALEAWGKSVFERLFGGQALLWYDRIRTTGLSHLVLKIASDDPKVLAWPWEALCDPHGTTLAHTCRLERQLNELHDPLPLPASLSRTQINILLVIARPYGNVDVGFQEIAGPLVEWVRADGVPVEIDVLRPPTFEALQARLAAHPGRYHIVHFDGHGGYGPPDSSTSRYAFGNAQGHLVFEDSGGGEVVVSAGKLTALLCEHRIPIMVLNACQSARIDERADDPFASTAAALLKAGVRSVVAMGYDLRVSGAQQFVPAFYRRLLQSGDVAEATRAGRKAMLEKDGRACRRGIYPLQDWLVPVLYQQETIRLPVDSAVRMGVARAELPDEAKALGDYGFIGRQQAIHQIERALVRQPAAAILVQGMAGIGKTMLAKGFLHWLGETGGLRRTGGLERADGLEGTGGLRQAGGLERADGLEGTRGLRQNGGLDPSGYRAADAVFLGVMWLSFDAIRSVEYVINQLVAACWGHEATSLPLEQKLAGLLGRLRAYPLLLVWDNFEMAAGIEGTELTPLLAEADRNVIKTLLSGLRGGRSKILITSRSPENWLELTEVFRLGLGGLRGNDVWTYCNAVVRDLGLALDRDDPQLIELLEALDGHPLALRSVLLRLGDLPAGELLIRLRREFAGRTGDESTRSISAALALLNQGLPESFSPALRVIGLHQRYININYVPVMMGYEVGSAEREVVTRVFHILERGGLLIQRGDNVYSMHPALHGFLTEAHPANPMDTRRFVYFMAYHVDMWVRDKLPNQRALFALYGANFQRAVVLANQLGEAPASEALRQGLALFAMDSCDYSTATRLYEGLAASWSAAEDKDDAGACHQLGLIAQQQHDLACAEKWYFKALEAAQKSGRARETASTCHQLSMVAQMRHDLVGARSWCLQSLELAERAGDQRQIAGAYHQLGLISYLEHDFVTAEDWNRKALQLDEQLGDKLGIAGGYHQNGLLAAEKGDFEAARRWYLQALDIASDRGDEEITANIYHQLGTLAQRQHDLTAAEQYYIRALEIKEKRGDLEAAAGTYHQLGTIARAQHDWVTAERWYLKALDIMQKLGSEHDMSMTCHELGLLAEDRDDFTTAAHWYRKSLAIREKLGDEYDLSLSYHQLGVLSHKQQDFSTAQDWHFKALAIREKGTVAQALAATTYHHLGRIAEYQGDFAAAMSWHLKSLALEEHYGNESGQAISCYELGMVGCRQSDPVGAREWFERSLAQHEKTGDTWSVALAHYQLGKIAFEQREFERAGRRFVNALVAFYKTKDEYHGAISAGTFVRCLVLATAAEAATLRQYWVAANLGEADLAVLERDVMAEE